MNNFIDPKEVRKTIINILRNYKLCTFVTILNKKVHAIIEESYPLTRTHGVHNAHSTRLFKDSLIFQILKGYLSTKFPIVLDLPPMF